MTGVAWSQEQTADVITAVQTIVDANLASLDPTVFDGPATQGAAPPFIVCWPVETERVAVGLGAECWGQVHQRWQIGAHGQTTAVARHMMEQLTQAADWPTGWELVEIGPPVEDRSDSPTTWFYPVILVYRGMT